MSFMQVVHIIYQYIIVPGRRIYGCYN